LYGIVPAAYVYFGKHPRDLNPVEAAFFSSILPAPKQRYVQFCDDKLSKWTAGKIQRILVLMNKRGRLSEEDLDIALRTELSFHPDKSVLCKTKEPRTTLFRLPVHE